MNKLMLKQVLEIEDIKKGIEGDLFTGPQEVKNAITETLKSNKTNVISVEVMLQRRPMTFENTLHVDKEKKIYLLESRLFDDKGDGQMKGAYLKIFNSNGDIIEEGVDDVWTYANWEIAE